MTDAPDTTNTRDNDDAPDRDDTPRRTWREWFAMVCERIGQVGVRLTKLAILVTLFGLLARWLWLGELVASLRIHVAAGLVVTALLAAVGRRWVWVAVALVFALANGGPTLALHLAKPPPVPGDAHHVRIAVANVLGSNEDPEPLIAWLESVDADIVVLVEVTDPFIEAFDARRSRWPYQAHDPQHGPFGLGVASRIGFTGVRLGMEGPGPIPVLDAEIPTPRGMVSLIGMHTLPPATPTFMRTRDDLMQWGADRAQSTANVVLVGDLNATTTSPAFRRLLRDGDFVDSRRGFGRHATWPEALGPLGIGIDHVLLRGDVVTADRIVGPDIGSDHRPILVEIAVGGDLMPASDR